MNEKTITKGNMTIWPHGPNSDYDGITANGWFGYSNDNLLWIRHANLKESRCYLRVPEEASWEGRQRLQLKAGTSVERLGTHDAGEKPKEHNYMVGHNWQVRENRLFFDPLPLRNPFGPSPGTIEATVEIGDREMVLTTVIIKNTSDKNLKHISAHFCFNHRMAPFLGRRIFVRTNEKWSNFNDYTNDTPYRGYTFGSKEIAGGQPEITERMILSETVLEKGGYFSAAIGGKSVTRLSSNSQWPCTDINLDFGDIVAGASSTREFCIGMGALDKDQMLERMGKYIK